MNTQSAAKQEVKQEAKQPANGLKPVGEVVNLPKQGTAVNYSPEQLAAYLESQLTGKAVVGKPFNQPIGETNFSEADRKAIQEARRQHRLTLAHVEAKSALLASIRSPKWQVAGFRENAKGDKRTMRFADTQTV